MRHLPQARGTGFGIIKAVETLVGARSGEKLVVNFRGEDVGGYGNTRTGRRLALGLAAAASILASGFTVTSTGVAACSDHVRNRRRSADCRTGDRSAARAVKMRVGDEQVDFVTKISCRCA